MAKAIRGRVWLLLFFIFAYSCHAKDLYTFNAYRVSCDQVSPKLAHNYSCFTRSINRTVKAHTIRITLLPNVTLNDMHLHMTYNQRINNAYRRTISDFEQDFCKFLDGNLRSPLIKILWPYLRKTSNMANRCPYSGLINITDLVFGDEYLPPALPEGYARLDIHVRNGKERTSVLCHPGDTKSFILTSN
ncbi:unnamed protein product [Hermetia illucens]|uniref:Uncharacterized protein n=1 Tax=Hermetia illucens TaxID=343691 RepID=A0A7R8V1E9_HERIL|nr:unnamed protein product [Hermetia illucens]